MVKSSSPGLKIEQPVISDQQQLPEISIKTFILSVFLSLLLATANAYLGLKMGQTVSASIPAAVFAMGLLKCFRGSNILENNIVQTAASAGEALVAGIAFTVPTLIVLHLWDRFHYWQTMTVALLGGLLGVIFAVPLRRILLFDSTLRFPEGRAIGQVLIATSGDKSLGFKELIGGGLMSAALQFAQNGLQCVASGLEHWGRYERFIWGYGLGFSPALLGAGYIIGLQVGLAIGCGILLGWLLGIPFLSGHFQAVATLSPLQASHYYWQHYVRYVGVGTMLVGGLWALCTLLKPLYAGLKHSMQSIFVELKHQSGVPRTQADIPVFYLLVGLILMVLPLVLLFSHVQPSLEKHNVVVLLGVTLAYVFIASFVFSAVCGYVAGLVGSTNSPVSGLTLAALMLVTVLLKFLWPYLHGSEDLMLAQLSKIIIFISGIVAGACAIGTDTIQDLKAGQIVGATPWKQQVMMMVGVIASALLIPFILQLLFSAYGMAGVFPRANMDPSQMLAAPQAGLMAVVMQGLLTQQLSWNMILIGVLIAVIFIFLDETWLKRWGGLPVMAVGLGIYLPLTTATPLFLGGVLSFFSNRCAQRNYPLEKQRATARHKATLLACGLVAGAALMGVLLAIPFALSESTDVFRIVSLEFEPIAAMLGLLSFGLLAYWLYRTGSTA